MNYNFFPVRCMTAENRQQNEENIKNNLCGSGCGSGYSAKAQDSSNHCYKLEKLQQIES